MNIFKIINLLFCCGGEFPSKSLTMFHELGIQQLNKEPHGFQELEVILPTIYYL